jgi:hypothetical protein
MSDPSVIFKWYPPAWVLAFHAAAEEYPLMNLSEREVLAADMRHNGFDANMPIVLLEGRILDGRNRYLAAKMAGVPFYTVTVPPGVDPRLFVERYNDHRRHEGPEAIEARRQRILAARALGQSVREIAEAEGVGATTVFRDLQKPAPAPVPEGTPDLPLPEKPERVLGADGKSYPAARPKKAGEEIFDWKAYQAAVSAHYRLPDMLVRAFPSLKDTAMIVELRKLAVTFDGRFKDLFDAQGKGKAPRREQ